MLTLDSGRGYDRLALDPGEYRPPGNVSSQFITGLLFVLPLLEGDSDLALTSPLESRGYVELTLDVLNRFGIQIEERRTASMSPENRAIRAGTSPWRPTGPRPPSGTPPIFPADRWTFRD